MTVGALAKHIGVTRQMLVRYEKGTSAPAPERVAKIASALDFAEHYFFREELEIAGPDAASFRALTSMSARDRDAALAAATVAIEMMTTLAASFELPNLDVPDLFGVKPEEAAAVVRQRWGLGQVDPLPNVVQLLEKYGVHVFSLVQDARTVDAFALWSRSVPYVFLNSMKSAERGRFDASHELAHLCLHQHEKPQGRQPEHEADAFASALLMPREGIVASAPADFSIHGALREKARWRVSVVAYVKRLHSLGLISDWDYRDTFITMSGRGWRTDEPSPALKQRESSALFLSLRDALADQGGFRMLASEIGVRVSELSDLIFGISPAVAAADDTDDDEDVADEDHDQDVSSLGDDEDDTSDDPPDEDDAGDVDDPDRSTENSPRAGPRSRGIVRLVR